MIWRVGLRMEISRLLETVALRINNRDNSQWDSGMRLGWTASTTIIVASNSQEVFICNMCSMSSWLHILHHEYIFLTVWLHNSLSFLLFRWLKSNCFQIKFEVSFLNIRMSRTYTSLCFVSQFSSISVSMSICTNSYLLLYNQSDIC